VKKLLNNYVVGHCVRKRKHNGERDGGNTFDKLAKEKSALLRSVSERSAADQRKGKY
jgi:hypothetical protein